MSEKQKILYQNYITRTTILIIKYLLLIKVRKYCHCILFNVQARDSFRISAWTLPSWRNHASVIQHVCQKGMNLWMEKMNMHEGCLPRQTNQIDFLLLRSGGPHARFWSGFWLFLLCLITPDAIRCTERHSWLKKSIEATAESYQTILDGNKGYDWVQVY